MHEHCRQARILLERKAKKLGIPLEAAEKEEAKKTSAEETSRRTRRGTSISIKRMR